VLSCVVSDNSTTSAANRTNWAMDATDPVNIQPDIDMRFMIENTRDGNVVTSVLTIESVTSSDNGTGYLCAPTTRIESFIGIISVAGEYVQCINYYLFTYVCMCTKFILSNY